MRSRRTTNRGVEQRLLVFDEEPPGGTPAVGPAPTPGAEVPGDPFVETEPVPEASPATPSRSRFTRTPRRDTEFVDGETIRRCFGRDLRSILDLDCWDRNPDIGALIHSITQRAQRVVERERARREPLRKKVVQLVDELPDRPTWAGFHRVTEHDLREVASTVLYNGSTEAVCGDYLIHNTVPLAIAQAGVCVVGYDGDQRQWHQRIVREEWEIELEDPDAEVEAMFQQRDLLSRPGGPNQMEMLNQLARRGFVSYMERLVMLRECPNKWRLGDGVPIPLDLLTGAANMDLLEMSLELMKELLLGDSRWAFVSHTSREPGLQMIGNALEPLEFVVLLRLRSRLREQVERGHYLPHYGALAAQFVEEVGPEVVLGAFRAGAYSPPWFFFARDDRAYEAALILMADALALQPLGFPPLLRLARTSCRAALGGEAFPQLIQQAYREAGAPEWFLGGALG